MAQPSIRVKWRRHPTMGFCSESLPLGWLYATLAAMTVMSFYEL